MYITKSEAINALGKIGCENITEDEYADAYITLETLINDYYNLSEEFYRLLKHPKDKDLIKRIAIEVLWQRTFKVVEDFCKDEYGEDTIIYSRDLEKMPLAHTTTDNEEEIQVYGDLMNHKIIKCVDTLETETIAMNFKEFMDYLENMTYEDLIFIEE